VKEFCCFVICSMFISICSLFIKARPFGSSFRRSLDVGRRRCIRGVGLYTQLCGVRAVSRERLHCRGGWQVEQEEEAAVWCEETRRRM
jgi:hypothetical protein